jgi:hypothetical protein
MNALLEAALHYVPLGWHVLPLHSTRYRRCSCGNPDCPLPGEHPRTRHGEKGASNDAEQIKAWWAQCPDANVGVATGPSGLVVIGVDRDKGLARLRELAGDELPVTRVARTRRGWDLYYTGDGIPSIRDKKLDVRGSTGYVMTPPSRHISGVTYKWSNAKPARPAPRWLARWAGWPNGAGRRLIHSAVRPIQSKA